MFILAWLWREGTLLTALKSQVPMLQLSRATLLVVDIWCFSAALSLMPLADLQAIFMLFPIVTTLLAIPLLGEQVGLVRWLAIIAGFIGIHDRDPARLSRNQCRRVHPAGSGV